MAVCCNFGQGLDLFTCTPNLRFYFAAVEHGLQGSQLTDHALKTAGGAVAGGAWDDDIGC